MKLESMNSSKFEAFRTDEISEAAKDIKGGFVALTQWAGIRGKGGDVYISGTTWGPWHDANGNMVDVFYNDLIVSPNVSGSSNNPFIDTNSFRQNDSLVSRYDNNVFMQNGTYSFMNEVQGIVASMVDYKDVSKM